MVACQQALHLGDHENYARERRRESGGRGRGTWKGKLATVTHKFSFPPRNRGVGFFPWWGITGNMCISIGATALMMSTEGTRN